MRARRLVAVAAFGFLLFFFIVSSTRPGELARRGRRVLREAHRDPALRRLEGSSAAFDRKFFFFLESARRRLPPGARGVAVAVPTPGEAYRNLVAYEFAPLPALLQPREVPEGWILAVYGSATPEGWREIARLSGGALLVRAP